MEEYFNQTITNYAKATLSIGKLQKCFYFLEFFIDFAVCHFRE
jgi:hypothetical protein